MENKMRITTKVVWNNNSIYSHAKGTEATNDVRIWIVGITLLFEG
jgi:hypothetical protein